MFVRNFVLILVALPFFCRVNGMENSSSASAKQPQKISEFVKKLQAAAPDNPFLRFLNKAIEEKCYFRSDISEHLAVQEYREGAAIMAATVLEQMLFFYDDLKELRGVLDKELVKQFASYGIAMDARGLLALALILGCDPNERYAYGSDVKGTKLLHCATAAGGQRAAMLLAAGARVDICDNEGSTPLHYACSHIDVGMAKALLEAGANPFIKNSFEETPRDVAYRVKKERNKDHYDKMVLLLDIYEGRQEQQAIDHQG